MRVVAVVPAKDRSDSIDATVRALLALAEPTTVARVVVVDDGSRDDTAARARAAGADTVVLATNVGKGDAVAAGVAAAPDADVYLLIDADLGDTARHAGSLLAPLGRDEADMAIAVLPAAGGRGGFGAVKWLAARGIRRASGRDVVAPLSGQRAVRASLLRSRPLAPRFGLETALTIDAVRDGARVVEVPVPMDHHHTGRRWSGFRHRAGQGVDVARALWPRLTTTRQRVAAILVGALVLVLAGFLSGSRWQAPTRPLLDAPTRHVLLIGLPRLSWDDVNHGRAPNFVALSQRGALGAMTVRTLSPMPSAVEAYASLGAGTRVKATTADVPAIGRENKGKHLASQPGTLGDALHRSGHGTAVVGSVGASAPALADRSGQVERRLAGDVRGAFGTADVVLFEGDDAALGALDLRTLPPDTLVIAFAPTPPGDDWHLAPVVVVGPGVARGRVTSPSTRRAGLVTLTDVAPTVLDALGVPVPSAMIGHGFRVHREARPSFAGPHELDRDAALRDHVNYPVTLTFIVFQAAIYLMTLLAFAGRGGVGSLARPLRVVVLAIAAFPLSTFLLRAVPNMAGLGDVGGVLTILAIDAAVVVVATRWKRAPLAALAVVLGTTAWVVMVDVATGARLQTNSIMGYSPTTAARFFGVGNAAFAVLASSALLAAGLHLVHAPRRREALVAVGAFFVLVLLADGAPQLGDDVGGLLTLVPVLGLTLFALSGRKVRWRTVAVAVTATIVVVAVAAGVDLLRAPSARTHLGRFVADIADHGSSPALTTIARKAATNARVFTSSVWTWLIVVIAAFMLGLLGLQRRFTDLLPRRSPHRAVVIGALAAGILGFLLNDSGSVVTALVFIFLGPYLTLLALHRSTVR